jgi:two-component system, LytTR family, sensor kinase
LILLNSILSFQTAKPLTIHIFTEADQYLVIENNLQKKTQFVPSNKVGLENIQQRYALLGGENIKVSAENQVFRVAIPMLAAATAV